VRTVDAARQMTNDDDDNDDDDDDDNDDACQQFGSGRANRECGVEKKRRRERAHESGERSVLSGRLLWLDPSLSKKTVSK